MTQELFTARLVLEPVRGSHAVELWPLVDDERMWRYFPHLRPASRDALAAIYRKWERGAPSADEVWLNWICRQRSTRVPVGTMQATVQRGLRAAYLAYAIYPAYQRSGYAAEASRAVIDHVRSTFAVRRILAEMDVCNEASFRLAESLGFKRIATRDREYVYELASAPLIGKSEQAHCE